MDILLLYLFTRVGAFHDVLVVLLIVTAFVAFIVLMLAPIWADYVQDEGVREAATKCVVEGGRRG